MEKLEVSFVGAVCIKRLCSLSYFTICFASRMIVVNLWIHGPCFFYRCL